MFCLSCGKKIAESSKFCKHCGSVQIKEDYSKYKFPFNSSPKKAWIFLWITTMLVFIISLFICAKFVDFKITLLSGKVLNVIFLVNILIGIFSFFAMAFSRFHSKNNKTYKFIKYIFFICLVYLIINPAVFAVEGYKAKTNEDYKNKYYSSPTLTPTPISPDFKNKLLEEINNYRSEQKINILVSDDEICKVAERLIKKEDLNEKLTKEDYIDLCPNCGGIGFAWIENVSTDNVLTKFKESEKTKEIISDKNYKYGCTAIQNQRILFFLGSKNTPSKKNISNVTNQNSIDCIGPDGKQFKTTMDECKKLNEKWGKTVDYMTNCNIHSDCGGGTIYMKYSECMKPCSGLPQKTNNTNINNNSSTNNLNKTAVFLTYGGYTIYCPSQNVGAVQTINSTMESKKTGWAKDYNDCTSNFFKTDSCFVACVNTEKSKLNLCDSLSDSYKSCSNAALDYYSSCIKTCPSASTACDYIYLEQKSLSSQINNLCK